MAATAEAPFRLPEQPLESEMLAKYFRGFGDATRMRILEALGTGAVHYRVADRRVLKLIELARALLEDNAEHVAACRRIDGGA